MLGDVRLCKVQPRERDCCEGIVVKSLRNLFAITAEALRIEPWNRCEIAAESIQNRLAIAVESLWNRFAIAMKALRNRCAIDSQSIRDRYGITVQSLRNRFTID
jgi:hypothetical protein